MSSTLRNIRSLASYVRAIWDWTDFNDCFEGTKIRIMDIDGMVERRGRFLLLEIKNYSDDHTIPYGQRLTYEALQRLGKFTIVFVWGDSNNEVVSEYINRTDTTAMLAALGAPSASYIRVLTEDGRVIEGNGTIGDLKTFIRDWFNAVNGGKPFPPK